jgi:hypothetical protein
MSTIFSAPAILTRIAYLKDGGLSLGFATNELSDEDKVIASRFHQKFGWVCFKENQFVEEDLPTTDATDEQKSPAQRLRAALFVLWKQQTDGQETKEEFEYFYRRQMERAINRVKKLLD